MEARAHPTHETPDPRSGQVTERREHLNDIMRNQDLQALVISSQHGVTYFSDVYLITQVIVPDRHAYLLARLDEQEILLVCDIEEALALQQSSVADVRTYIEFELDPTAALCGVLRESGLMEGRLGIEARRLPVAASETLRRELRDVALIPIDDDLERLTVVKSSPEVDILRMAALATQDAIESAVRLTRAGEPEAEFAARIIQHLSAGGGLPTFLVFGSGVGSVVNHLEASDKRLAVGEVFRVDVGARWTRGLQSDLGRCGVVGEPSARQSEVFHVLRTAQDEVFALIEPMRPVRDLHRACKNAVEREGLPFSMPHIGHGLGIDLHEMPRLHPYSDAVLTPGMVINIEPLIILVEENAGYFTEDLVCVTHEGHELLSRPQEALLTIADV